MTKMRFILLHETLLIFGFPPPLLQNSCPELRSIGKKPPFFELFCISNVVNMASVACTQYIATLESMEMKEERKING